MLALTICACQKENIDETSTISILEEPTIITTSLGDVAGLVLDEEGKPLADAFVQLGNQQTNTNEFGVFLLEEAELNSQATYLTVQKDGYFQGSRTFVPTENARQNVRIQLLKKTQAGSFQAAQASTIEVEANTNIQFQSNGIIDANGNPYQGEVVVFAQRLDPLASNLSDIMQGNLTGLNADNQRVALSSFGMLAVELESPSGESLQLALDSPATIEFEVPSELQGVAPATIPLWHFDEIQGIWLEEGEATLQGNVYVGEVPHFSNWNWDIPHDKIINFTGKIQNYNRVGLGGLTVSIHLVNKWTGGYTVTDQNGCFSAPLPNGKVFDIQIYYQEDGCDEPFILYEAQIGPFEEDAQLPPVYVDLATIQGVVSTFEVTGTVVDCEGNPSLGYIQLYNQDANQVFSFLSEADGTFNEAVVSCAPIENLTATATNLENFESVSTIDQTFADAIDFGQINICDGTSNNSFYVSFNTSEIYITENDTEYRDAQYEYLACDDTYYFEMSWASPESMISGLVIESSTPITTGEVYNADGYITIPTIENFTIQFSQFDNERAAGTITLLSDGTEGIFSVPFSN